MLDILRKPQNTLTELSSERLKVWVADPASVPGSRWDRTGFITQVMLDGHRTFCGVEGGGNLGQGLCNEFGITQAIGYEEAKPGEAFPKLGVGLLRRRNWDDYPFWKTHLAQKFDIAIAPGESGLHYVVQAKNSNGYAARMEKWLQVQDNQLRVEYQLENTGEKLIDTNEYNHNFIALDGLRPGPGHVLRSNLPWRKAFIHTEKEADTISFRGEEIHWRRPPRSAFNSTLDLNDLPTSKEGWWWELRHTGFGFGVRETVWFEPSRIVLYFNRGAICPEVFKPLQLAPGESTSWVREWTFFDAGLE